MKVACIGNSNHNLLTFVRVLRRKGIDAHLFLLQEIHHFLPHNDSLDLDYREYTHQLFWEGNFYADNIVDVVRTDMKGYDYIIACQWAPAFLNKAGVRIDLICPVGIDIYGYPFPKPKAKSRFIEMYISFNRALGRAPKKTSEKEMIHSHQFHGIKNSRAIWTGSVQFREILEKRFDYRGQLIIHLFPLVDAELYSKTNIKKYYDQSHWYKAVSSFYDKFDVKIFNQSRQLWTSKRAIDNKGSDKLIRGVQKAILKGVSVGLVLLEYGDDVFASKNLVRELGLDNHVLWLPISPRKEIMVAMSLADATCGSFGESWFIGSAIFEGLAMGKPLFHFRDDKLYTDMFEEFYPIVNVNSADQIADAIVEMKENPKKFSEIGDGGIEWYNRVVMEKGVNKIMELLASPK